MNLRDGFADIVSGWMLVDDFADLTERIERAAEWMKENGPLNEDEDGTIKLMIEAQIARGIRRGDFAPYIASDVPLSLLAVAAVKPDLPDDEAALLDLGSCCICGGTEAVNNIVLLDRRAPIAGHGWCCFVCNLPADGAYAVLCDRCLPDYRTGKTALLFVCRGHPAEDGRAAFKDLSAEPFEHDMAKHAADDAS